MSDILALLEALKQGNLFQCFSQENSGSDSADAVSPESHSDQSPDSNDHFGSSENRGSRLSILDHLPPPPPPAIPKHVWRANKKRRLRQSRKQTGVGFEPRPQNSSDDARQTRAQGPESRLNPKKRQRDQPHSTNVRVRALPRKSTEHRAHATRAYAPNHGSDSPGNREEKGGSPQHFEVKFVDGVGSSDEEDASDNQYSPEHPEFGLLSDSGGSVMRFAVIEDPFGRITGAKTAHISCTHSLDIHRGSRQVEDSNPGLPFTVVDCKAHVTVPCADPFSDKKSASATPQVFPYKKTWHKLQDTLLSALPMLKLRRRKAQAITKATRAAFVQTTQLVTEENGHALASLVLRRQQQKTTVAATIKFVPEGQQQQQQQQQEEEPQATVESAVRPDSGFFKWVIRSLESTGNSVVWRGCLETSRLYTSAVETDLNVVVLDWFTLGGSHAKHGTSVEAAVCLPSKQEFEQCVNQLLLALSSLQKGGDVLIRFMRINNPLITLLLQLFTEQFATVKLCPGPVREDGRACEIVLYFCNKVLSQACVRRTTFQWQRPTKSKRSPCPGTLEFVTALRRSVECKKEQAAHLSLSDFCALACCLELAPVLRSSGINIVDPLHRHWTEKTFLDKAQAQEWSGVAELRAASLCSKATTVLQDQRLPLVARRCLVWVQQGGWAKMFGAACNDQVVATWARIVALSRERLEYTFSRMINHLARLMNVREPQDRESSFQTHQENYDSMAVFSTKNKTIGAALHLWYTCWSQLTPINPCKKLLFPDLPHKQCIDNSSENGDYPQSLELFESLFERHVIQLATEKRPECAQAIERLNLDFKNSRGESVEWKRVILWTNGHGVSRALSLDETFPASHGIAHVHKEKKRKKKARIPKKARGTPAATPLGGLCKHKKWRFATGTVPSANHACLCMALCAEQSDERGSGLHVYLAEVEQTLLPFHINTATQCKMFCYKQGNSGTTAANGPSRAWRNLGFGAFPVKAHAPDASKTLSKATAIMLRDLEFEKSLLIKR